MSPVKIENTPAPATRTSAATAAAALRAAERRAEWLRERGWLCYGPHAVVSWTVTSPDDGTLRVQLVIAAPQSAERQP